MVPFNIGDLVVMNSGAEDVYSITVPGTECEIVNIDERRWDGATVKVKITNHASDESEIGQEYWVMPECIDLMSTLNHTNVDLDNMFDSFS